MLTPAEQAERDALRQELSAPKQSSGLTPQEHSEREQLRKELGVQAPSAIGSIAKGVGQRSLEGALSAVPGAASLKAFKSPNSDWTDKVAAVGSDAAGAAMGVATGGLSVPAGMAINAALEGSGINPLFRKAEKAIEENAVYPDAETRSVPLNMLLNLPKNLVGTGVGLLPSIVAGMGAAKLAPKTFNSAVPKGQELPALNNVLKKGIGPEIQTAQAGSTLPEVLEGFKTNRSGLGNNIGQVVAAAQSKVGKLNPKSLQPQIGNAVSNALESSGVSTPLARAAVDKWFKTDLPEITDLVSLHDSIKNFKNSIKSHMGVEGDISSVPLGNIKNAMSEILKNHMPEEFKASFEKANKGFSQLASVEEGVKAATPGLKAKLKGKTPAIGAKTDFNLDPGKFAKWFNETLSEAEKARMDPALREGLEQLTSQPSNPLMTGIRGLAKGATGLADLASLGVVKGPKFLQNLAKPTAPRFSESKPTFLSSPGNSLFSALATARKPNGNQ